jgi:tetratricopeptide (TPR) repeat protein
MKSRIQAQATSRSVISGAIFWIALLDILAVFSLSSVALRAESANTFFKRGQTAEAKEDYDTAFDNYQKAYAKAPRTCNTAPPCIACGLPLRPRT